MAETTIQPEIPKVIEDGKEKPPLAQAQISENDKKYIRNLELHRERIADKVGF